MHQNSVSNRFGENGSVSDGLVTHTDVSAGVSAADFVPVSFVRLYFVNMISLDFNKQWADVPSKSPAGVEQNDAIDITYGIYEQHIYMI
jgi:hypothetical protein